MHRQLNLFSRYMKIDHEKVVDDGKMYDQKRSPCVMTSYLKIKIVRKATKYMSIDKFPYFVSNVAEYVIFLAKKKSSNLPTSGYDCKWLIFIPRVELLRNCNKTLG